MEGQLKHIRGLPNRAHVDRQRSGFQRQDDKDDEQRELAARQKRRGT